MYIKDNPLYQGQFEIHSTCHIQNIFILYTNYCYMISTSKTLLMDGNFHPPMKTRKIFFCDKVRKEMYKVLNLR